MIAPLINTVASARWMDAVVKCELFQQFTALEKKPLKRLGHRSSVYHRAEATVLMRGVSKVMAYWG
jgi:hypothetical protein